MQLKTGYNTDAGPAWITRLRFTCSWQTAYFRGRILHRWRGFDSNFYDVETEEEYRISVRNGTAPTAATAAGSPKLIPDVRAEYEAFPAGAPRADTNADDSCAG